MELLEPIETLNKRLIDHYGIDSLSSMPIWRIVWSEDQFEVRYGTFEDRTPAGLYIRTVTEHRRVPKYRQYNSNRHILEQLVIVPEFQQHEIPESKMSYEPFYVYESSKGPLPPKWEPTKFLIDLSLSVRGKGNVKRYFDPDEGISEEEFNDREKKRIDSLVNELFGDDLGQIGLDVMVGQGIHVPHNYEKSKS